MAATFPAGAEPGASTSTAEDPTEDLARLRSLLLGRDYAELIELKRQLASPEHQARQTAAVLAEAVRLRSEDDAPGLTHALLPTIEDALKISVQRNPQPLVDALFPVIGPAIRRAISEAIAQLMQTVNQLLDNSLSPRSLKWRWEATRSGVSYAEIVLRHTLVFQVEQVVLIHRQTGLPLRHRASPKAVVKDPAMVSGMLTAIQDFVADSFSVGEQASLQQTRFGDLTVLIEPGPHALLAAAVRGHPPAELREVLAQAIEQIHLRFADALERFDGDDAEFAAADALLDDCLRSQVQPAVARPARGRAIWPWGVVTAVLVLVGAWLYLDWRNDQTWNAALARLRAEPGLVVIEAAQRDGARLVRGLRDPLARDPQVVIGAEALRALAIRTEWEPYLALTPVIVNARAQRVLDTPPGVRWRIEGDTLHVSGTASRAWIDTLERRAASIAGVAVVKREALVAEAAPEQVLAGLVRNVESRALTFEFASATLDAQQLEQLAALVAEIRRLEQAAGDLAMTVKVRVVGHSDLQGSAARNLRLSRARADAVVAALVERGIDARRLEAEGVGARVSLRHGAPAEQAARENRRVNFEVLTARAAGGKTP